MSKQMRGIYVATDGESLAGFGDRKAEDPAGLAWHSAISPAGWDLLEAVEDLRFLRWNGSTVVHRTQSEISAILATDDTKVEDAFFEERKLKAALTALVRAVNVRLVSARLPKITREEFVELYRKELGR